MAWFKRDKPPLAQSDEKKVRVPEGLWTKCQNCRETLYSKDLEKNHNVCPKCNHHFRISAGKRVELLLDEGSFVEFDADLVSIDFLEFKDSKSYQERIDAAVAKGGSKDAVICGEGKIEGAAVQVAIFDFSFMGGSMGSVVGEKITRAIERGIEKRMPVIIVSSSGGARMQESILSLMQMAKTSAALAKLREDGIAVHLCPHRSHHRRGYRQFRHAGGHQYGGAKRTDWFCRSAGHRTDHQTEAAGGISACRISSGARHGRSHCGAQRDAAEIVKDIEHAASPIGIAKRRVSSTPDIPRLILIDVYRRFSHL